MIFKPLSNLSRHATLAKNLWIPSSSNPQPPQQSFFISTRQLARQQAQLAVRNSTFFDHNGDNASSSSANAYASVGGTTCFHTISPLSSLDDEKQREVVSSGRQTSGILIKNLSSLRTSNVPFRRYSTSSRDTTAIEEGDAEVARSPERRSSSPDLSDISAEASAEVSQADPTQEAARLESSHDEPVSPRSTESTVYSDVSEDSLSSSLRSADTAVTEDLDTPVNSAINRSYQANDYKSVVQLYRDARQDHQIPSLSAYNRILVAVDAESAASAEITDISLLLDVYTDMLTCKVKPDVETYTFLIDRILDVAKETRALASGVRLRNVTKRHGKDALLPSVSAELSNTTVADLYAGLAVDIYTASSSVRLHNYSAAIYARLLDTCVYLNRLDTVDRLLSNIKAADVELTSQLVSSMLRSLGAKRDLARAVDLFRAHQPNDFEVLSSMISVHFECDDAAGGTSLLKHILDNEPDAFLASKEFESVLLSAINGFASQGRADDAWRWIHHAENDPRVVPLSLEAMVPVFSGCCADVTTEAPHQMFDFLACYETAASSSLFDEVRSDYAMLCVRTGNDTGLYKVIKETHLRKGVWDETTIAAVVEYLTKLGDAEMAVDVVQMMTSRLADGSDSQHAIEGELFAAVIKSFRDNALLTPDSALALAKSPSMNMRAFANSEGGAIDLMESIWSARVNADFASTVFASKRASILDVLRLHTLWIKSSASGNSLGTLSIPTPLLIKIKRNFACFVNDAMSVSLAVDEKLAAEVVESLQLLEDGATLSAWAAYNAVEQAIATPPPVESATSSSEQIMAYANVDNGLLQSAALLKDAIVRGESINPDAILYVLEAAARQKAPAVIADVYNFCRERLPHPATSVDAWDAWCTINRYVVQTCAELDFPLAHLAYMSLLDMKSCPDATGYGQIMSHWPLGNSKDEASDALRLFGEAQAMGIPLNTFVYNVLLSKLSKARKLREAVTMFNEMEASGIKKSSVTYGTMISACCRAGDGESAATLFDDMEASPTYVPRVAPFNIMLQYYVHTKRDRESGLKMYAKLRKSGVTPSAHTYKLLIDMYSTIEPIDLNAADQVLLAIKKNGQRATTQHFAALMYARGVCLYDLAGVEEFYSKLVGQRVRPDKVIFQALLESYVVNDRVQDTPRVLEEMIKYGVELNAYMANILIRGWASVSIHKSVGLFDYILGADLAEPSSYESMIRAFIFHGDFASAQNVLSLMRANGYPEPVVQKVEYFVREQTTTSAGNQVLLGSIFRHDAHQLGWTGIGEARA